MDMKPWGQDSNLLDLFQSFHSQALLSKQGWVTT